ncbi:MAG: ribosomal-protein-alanine N-acetyltransferase [Nitrospirae bacterium CG_4_10_14_0_8_um_filter_41_23]|nr:ribosomal protein S18-alanine N-acetyltransferase [Nitrospirota bacterium]OIP59839.1 MAG: ribosomal-protein-alanine N-acetyltransferase [Nitrospirae bacterium CG2_30_41_42]PIQ93181.1 MAG: ribosomal-protein-alanine N-acetyltransferase [Nitrospirae bacterium CG11_big_fil_rev_8_21_14_0_20_41_14]PIV44744.1 MAG: ribosomal-protein-alanine N-acetyltransferase [Nitrospirae bacterium CG02_land_8_20_14_3_00_41_53]PIW87480.1 MAG: ribosomal-protein-alanine N-acetyltransferase [Nitrospirae bacterium CG_4
MPEILIREMQVSDIPDVLQIEHMSFTTPWSKDAFLNEIHKLYSFTKVAVLGDNIIGYICINHIMDEGHILNLAVHPDFRRQGIATKLVEDVLNGFKEIDCRHLYLEVRVSNLEAKKFYERLGFRVMGTKKDYYTYPIEDAVIMMRGL